MHTFSVSALTQQIKTLLETSFSRVLVEGEISRITFHNSGHIYFTLKDSAATIRAVMFKGNASKLRFQLKEGLKVVVDGAVTLYQPRGEYQLNCFTIEPAGHGALALAFEQLKEKLSAKGYFEPSIKKPLPKFPKKIALITSATGAAVQDMYRVANSRYRAIEIDLYDVLVQGANAAPSISSALQFADTKGYDVVVIGRGGGSIEDLWAFNEEIVADAVHHATTPVVSAVGHEIDCVISDFVADMRAATPSAAMQLILPDTNELYQNIDDLSSQFLQVFQQKIYNKEQQLKHLYTLFAQHSIEKSITQKLEEIERLKQNLTNTIAFKFQSSAKEIEYAKQSFPHAIDNLLKHHEQKLDNLTKMLENNNPKLKSKKGFAQVSKDNKVVELSVLEIDDVFEAMDNELKISAKVLQKELI